MVARIGVLQQGLSHPALIRRLPLALALVLWLFVSARELLRQLDHPGMFGVAVCFLTILTPIVLLRISRLPIYLLMIYAALVPFTDLLNTNGNGPTASKLVAIAAGAALLVAMLFKRGIVKPTMGTMSVVLLTAYLAATMFWAIDPAVALSAYGMHLNNALLFIAIVSYCFTLQDLKLILASTIAGAIAAAAYGDYLFWRGQEVSGARLYIGYSAAHSIDPNSFATGLLPPIAVLLVLFLGRRSLPAKAFWLSLLFVLLSAFMISGSRGATFGGVAMLACLLWQSRFKKSVLAIAAVLAVWVMTSPIGQRFARGDLGDADGRTEIWKVGIASLRDYWLWGAGVGNFTAAYTQFYLQTPHRWLEWERVAHSIFIQSAVEYGLIGFLLLMTFWYLQFHELGKVQPGGTLGDVCVAIRAGVLGLFVAGFSLDLMLYKYTWLTLALASVMRSTLTGNGVTRDSAVKTKSEPALGVAIPSPTTAR